MIKKTLPTGTDKHPNLDVVHEEGVEGAVGAGLTLEGSLNLLPEGGRGRIVNYRTMYTVNCTVGVQSYNRSKLPSSTRNWFL